MSNKITMSTSTSLGDQHHAIVDAVFDVVAREGASAAAPERIAHVSSLPLDTVHRYFSSPIELVRFVKHELENRLTHRHQQVNSKLLISEDPSITAADRCQILEDILAQFLPLDEKRRQESLVWLALSMDVLSQPSEDPLAHTLHESILNGVRDLLSGAQRFELFRTDLDIEVEAHRLTALIDGLTAHAVLHSQSATAKIQLAVLRQHLKQLITID